MPRTHERPWARHMVFVGLWVLCLFVPATSSAQKSPNAARQSYERARQAFDRGRHQESLYLLERTERLLGGTNVRIESLRARILAAQGKDRALLKSMRRLDRMLPSNTNLSILTEARRQHRSAQLRASKEDAMFRKGTSHDPGSSYHLRRARASKANYSAYLRAYPKGVHATRARVRVQSLTRMIQVMEARRRRASEFSRLNASWSRATSLGAHSSTIRDAITRHRKYNRRWRQHSHTEEVRSRAQRMEGLFATAKNGELIQERDALNRRAQALSDSGSSHALAGAGFLALSLAAVSGGAFMWIAQPLSSGSDDGFSFDFPIGGVLVGTGIALAIIQVPEHFEDAGDDFESAERLRRQSARKQREAQSYLRRRK